MMDFFKGSCTVSLGTQVWPHPVMKARGISKATD